MTRCQECPLHELDQVRGRSPAGRLLDRVLELEFNTANFQVPWGDVTTEERTGLKILKEERDRHQAEQQKKDNP